MNITIKKLFTILLAILIISTLALALFACTPEPSPSPSVPEEPVTPVEDPLIIKNGKFINTTGTTYPLVPSDWAGAPGSTSGTQATPTGADKLLAGVISVEEAKYNQNKNLWGDLANPGKIGEDDNILMIHNKVPTAYKYSNTFSVEAGKHYKVSIPVKSIVAQGKGAYIYVTGGAYASFEAIDTNNIWTIYTVYIESSLISSENVTITLALGYGASDSGNMTEGFAFFDDIIADEITEAVYKEQTIGLTTAKYTLRVPDSRMEYSTGTTAPFSPYGYASKTGTGAGGSAPYYSTDLAKGIVDTSNWNTLFGDNPNNAVEGFGNKVLMLNNKNATASGYSGNRKVRFGIGNYYELSIDVYVKLTDGQTDLQHKGATLILSGPDSFKIENINTDGTWVRYSFFIEANQVRDKDFNLEMWLGQGGKDDTDTLTKGFAFFDNITLNSITEGTYNAQKAAKEANADYPNFVGSLVSLNANLIDNYNLNDINPLTGLPTGWAKETSSTTVIVGDNDINYISIPQADLNAAEWTTELIDKYHGLSENPLSPYPTMAPVFMINNSIPTVSGMGLVDELTFKSNLHYRMAIWLKTVDIAEGKGIDIKLITGEGTDMKTLSSFTTINTDTYKNNYANDYLEVVFLIQGNELIDKSARVVIEIGSGTAFDPSKYVSGYTLIANVNMEQITNSEYNSTTATSYVKKYSYTESSSTVANGNFNKLDLSKTEVDANGKLTNKPGVPDSWTASTSTETNVTAGIVDTSNEGLLNALALTDVYNNDGWTFPFPVDFGSPNLLMIQSAPALGDFDGKIKPYGYASNSFTLSKSSYYIIKAYVKTIVVGENNYASIYLTPTTNMNPINFTSIKTDGKWQEFIFVVATGSNSVTTKVELYLGNKNSESKFEGTVLFDSISYNTIDKDQFESYTTDGRVIKLSYQVETFDNLKTSSTALPTPNNWTGALGNSALPSGASNLVYGVHSSISGDATDLGVKDNDGNLIPESKIDNEAMRDIIFNDSLTTIGSNVLMINNKIPSAYSYKTSSAETLVKDSYYEISVWVFTYYIAEGKSARVMLSIGEDTFSFKDVNTTTYVDGVATTGTWTQYAYYIKTAETANTSSTYLTLGLGRYLAKDTDGSSLVSGFAFFDNVNIKVIDQTLFNDKKAAFDLAKTDTATTEQKAFMNTNSVILIDEPEASTPSDPTDPDEEEPQGPASNFPWLLVSSAIIGGVIVVAMIAVIIKKLYPKIAARRKLRFKKTNYDRTTSKDKTTTKSNRYDKYKD